MTKILITWELGGGLGHLTPMLALAEHMQNKGHQVALASRDLFTAGSLFQSLPITFYQAPHRVEPFKSYFDPPVTYGNLLHNIGFGSETGLLALSSAWISIFNGCKPDVVLFEHSPTAVFAARGFSFRKAVIGTGFSVPPTPLPVIRPWVKLPQLQMSEEHGRTVEIANLVARQIGCPTLKSLDEVYENVEIFLRTYPELDHFGRREGARYIGVHLDTTGRNPQWPYGDGPKIFAYLKPFQGFREAVAEIYKLKLPSIVFCPGLRSPEVTELEAAFPSIAFTTDRLSIELVVKSCDIAICHGGHGMVARMLIAGIPVIAIPLQLEQTLLSQRLTESGAGIHLAFKDIAQLTNAVKHLLSNADYYDAAKQIANKYLNDAMLGSWRSMASWIDPTEAV